jgi:hypothetical protein
VTLRLHCHRARPSYIITTMALWTGFPAGIGLKQTGEPALAPRRPLNCRAKSDDFGRKLSYKFILSDEVRTDY